MDGRLLHAHHPLPRPVQGRDRPPVGRRRARGRQPRPRVLRRRLHPPRPQARHRLPRAGQLEERVRLQRLWRDLQVRHQGRR